MKSAKTALTKAVRSTLEFALSEAGENAEVVQDASSNAEPPTIRLQNPTEAETRPSKDQIDPVLTMTMRITGTSELQTNDLAAICTERLAGQTDNTHRLDLSAAGFRVTGQRKDDLDTPDFRTTDTGRRFGCIQRYRFELETL